MSHVVNGAWKELLKIGSMLELKKVDIDRLKKMVSKEDRINLQIASLQDPINSYKNSGPPYYGTISLRDFR